VIPGSGASIMVRARLDPGVLLVAGLLVSGCLRAPIGDDLDSEGLGSSGWTDEGETTGLGASETTVHDESSGDTSGGDTSAEPTCHPSYDPCLPVVEDLNCPDVVAMGAAPVTVVGPDDYGLDADHDGVGCES
jgi:hypothetical protein